MFIRCCRSRIGFFGFFGFLFLAFTFSVCELSAQEEANAKPVEKISKFDAIEIGVGQLLKIQNDDGAWPYEGVYRVNRNIPVGYRIGGTAICCQALMYATKPDHETANEAISLAIGMIL